MPYKIKNIAKYPIVILTHDGDKKIKHNIQPNEFEIFWFIPPTASQFHIRNIVTIEYITPNDVLPTPKLEIENQVEDEINEDSIKKSGKKTKNEE